MRIQTCLQNNCVLRGTQRVHRKEGHQINKLFNRTCGHQQDSMQQQGQPSLSKDWFVTIHILPLAERSQTSHLYIRRVYLYLCKWQNTIWVNLEMVRVSLAFLAWQMQQGSHKTTEAATQSHNKSVTDQANDLAENSQN